MHFLVFSGSVIPYADLQVVKIYFDTDTFDEIERDVKVSSFWREVLDLIVMFDNIF